MRTWTTENEKELVKYEKTLQKKAFFAKNAGLLTVSTLIVVGLGLAVLIFMLATS